MEGQPIENIIDTGSPNTIIPLIINPKKLTETTKCFVDVNKNPIKFKGEALVEVKIEKSTVALPIIPNMQELISRISAKITESNRETWMSTIDLVYAYGLAKLSKDASKHCVFCIIGGNFTGHYRFKKGLYGLLDFPTVFQEHIHKVCEHRCMQYWFGSYIVAERRGCVQTKSFCYFASRFLTDFDKKYAIN